MKTYEKNIENRKELVSRLEELTGLKAHYTFVPRCAYEIGAFTVEKDGSLTVQDDADENILETLMADGMIKAEEAETTEVSESAEEPETEEDADEAETTEETTEEAEEPAETGIAFPIDTSVSFPLSQHSSTSLINLVCTVYSRGTILSKATGGEFHVDKDLVDALQSAKLYTAQSVLEFLNEWDGEPMTGIAFTEDKVAFTGFTGVQDAEHVRTFMKLAAIINKAAITQKRVIAKEVDMTNEKYAMRNWLIRLGMDGDEYKADRKILMENLTGHVAFRTPADEAKWKARQQEKRDELRAAKAAAAEEVGA
jgi:hypothetical protein